MENVDMFNNATAQLTFHNFLGRMRHSSAADLVRSIKNFISAFMSPPPEPERDSQRVQDFLSDTEDAFRAHPLWAGATEEEFESSGEGLEKYLMTKLYTRAFAPLPEDAEHDQRLSEKMSILQRFIRPEHLDISESFQDEASWLLAEKELQKINMYKAPRDKVVCILNCCRVINNLLVNASTANNENPPGADDFLPVLIYVVIKTNPPQLHSNLQYIQRYRHHSRLVSEASYFYTNLVSAESFIDNLNSSSLTMDPAEFEEKMKAGRREVQTANVTLPASVLESQTSSSLKEKTSLHHRLKDAIRADNATGDSNRASAGKGEKHVQLTAIPAVATPAPEVVAPEGTGSGTGGKVSSVEKLEAESFGQVLEADKNGQLAKDYPFLYASAGDLRVMDVESLLHEYKEVVLRYVALRKGVEGSVRPDEPPVSFSMDTKQERGAADAPESAREAPVESESLAQVLTRPEDTAELFLEETANLQSEPSLVPNLQPQFRDVSSDDTPRENESAEKSEEGLPKEESAETSDERSPPKAKSAEKRDEIQPKDGSAEKSNSDEISERQTDEGSEAVDGAQATGSPKQPASPHSIGMVSRSEGPSPPDTDFYVT